MQDQDLETETEPRVAPGSEMVWLKTIQGSRPSGRYAIRCGSSFTLADGSTVSLPKCVFVASDDLATRLCNSGRQGILITTWLQERTLWLHMLDKDAFAQCCGPIERSAAAAAVCMDTTIRFTKRPLSTWREDHVSFLIQTSETLMSNSVGATRPPRLPQFAPLTTCLTPTGGDVVHSTYRSTCATSCTGRSIRKRARSCSRPPL